MFLKFKVVISNLFYVFWNINLISIFYFYFFYRQLNLPQIQKILQEFEKQSEIMDMKEEIMNDAIDDAMEDEGDEEERYFTYTYI